jgi:hypothetical protein
VATWIILIAALVVALIVGATVLVVVLATRPKSRGLRIPGLSRFTEHVTENDPLQQ